MNVVGELVPLEQEELMLRSHQEPDLVFLLRFGDGTFQGIAGVNL